MIFIQAANYTKGRIKKIRVICLHDMESPESATTAEGVANFFHNQPKGSNGSSAHVCVDNDSAVQCVRDGDTAWAAPGANADGLHIEQAGYARQTRSQWLDPYSRAVIKRAAHVAAGWCHEYGIRPQMLTDTELRNGKATGITTHLQVTRVLNGGVGHTDPGEHYPRDLFMADLADAMRRFDAPGPFTDGQRALVDDTTAFLNHRHRGPDDIDRVRVVKLRDAANNLLGRD